MKKYIFILLAPYWFYSQNTNVGINTSTPTRKLDINGNLRITTATDVTPVSENAATHKRVLVAESTTGDIDYITIPAIAKSGDDNVEVRRIIYNSTTPVTANTCNCGDITFRINNTNNLAEFNLNSTTVFTSNSVTSFDLNYGIKRWTDASYSYENRGAVTLNTANYTTYQSLDTTVFPTSNNAAGNTIRIYTFSLPKQNHLYRITLSRIHNSGTNYTYGLVCEKFYMTNLQ